MLPAILVTIATFLMEFCSSSPIYNMQPAFITTNIGSIGRNIRNLPCISRKNNQSGVCMFAIDCLKANGTHLGTCIDRFYFGSCCHVEPSNDIIENTIESDIIPAREPPLRLSSTLRPISTTRTTPPVIKTSLSSTIKLTTSSSTTSIRSSSISTTLSSTTVSSTTPSSTTSTKSTKITTPKLTEKSPSPIIDETTTIGYKLTTFQSVESSSETTPKVTTTKTTTRRSTVKPKTTTKPKLKPKPTTRKPPKTTIKSTTIKHKITTPFESSTKSTTVPSNEVVSINKVNVTSVLVNGNVATNEIEAPSTIKPLTTSKKPSPTKISTTSTTTSSTTTTNIPLIVTWTETQTKKNESISSTTVNSTSEGEDWVPVTTPDGWVLLPNVPSNSTVSIPSQPTTTESASPNTTFESTLSTFLSTLNVSIVEETTSVVNSTSPTLSVTATTPSGDRPVNMSDFTDVCGRRMYPEARIVGGEKSTFGKWPWQISLRQWRTSTYLHKCGAALLNENWAITAAHCVDNVPPSDLLLRLGEHDLSTESEPYLHQERRVQIVASHPQFDPRTFEYDLALLRFYEPVNFQPNILPVCVPQNEENFVGRTAFVTGWGRLYEDGPLPSILQEVSVPVINNSVCESMYRSAGYIEHIPHIFICAGWRKGGFDSCEGDSGGPMVIQREDKRFLLAGVISWGIGCAEPNQPGVYTRISEFKDWINQILQF